MNKTVNTVVNYTTVQSHENTSYSDISQTSHQEFIIYIGRRVSNCPYPR